MENQLNTERFIKAQSTHYDNALDEIKNGQKSSNWMVCIFPQIKGVTSKIPSLYYGIKNKEDAIAYYNHTLLGNRLKEITVQFLSIQGKSAREILGSIDNQNQMKSCMSLFHLIQNETDIFSQVLEKYFDGALCKRTKRLINRNTEGKGTQKIFSLDDFVEKQEVSIILKDDDTHTITEVMETLARIDCMEHDEARAITKIIYYCGAAEIARTTVEKALKYANILGKAGLNYEIKH